MSKRDDLVDCALAIANDNTHGYSRVDNQGPDYDCGSFISKAAQNAGIFPAGAYFEPTGSTDTGIYSVYNEYVLLDNGFSKIPYTSLSNLVKGDILINLGHTVLYVGANQFVEASGDTDGMQGDSHGDEISVHQAYENGWVYVYRLKIMGDTLVSIAKALAADNRYHYYNKQTESRFGPYTFDCATFLSFVIYTAMGWGSFPNESHGGGGYYWPHISEDGYDAFLLANGWTKLPYQYSYLEPGAIIIADESLGHTLMYCGNGEIVDANDRNQTDLGDTSIAVREWPTYDTSCFAYIYLPPDSGGGSCQIYWGTSAGKKQCSSVYWGTSSGSKRITAVYYGTEAGMKRIM